MHVILSLVMKLSSQSRYQIIIPFVDKSLEAGFRLRVDAGVRSELSFENCYGKISYVARMKLDHVYLITDVILDSSKLFAHVSLRCLLSQARFCTGTTIELVSIVVGPTRKLLDLFPKLCIFLGYQSNLRCLCGGLLKV